MPRKPPPLGEAARNAARINTLLAELNRLREAARAKHAELQREYTTMARRAAVSRETDRQTTSKSGAR